LPVVDLRTGNLARTATYGEQVLVGLPPEEGAPPEPAPAGPDPPGNGDPDAPIDLNTAPLEHLQELPGVGPVLAQRLVDYRTQHGRFTAVDELLDDAGIGEARFTDLESRVTAG
jgi:competence protein ComEA